MTTLEDPTTNPPGDGSPDPYPKLHRPDASAEGTGVFLLAASLIVVLLAGIIAIGMVALLRNDSTTTEAVSTTNLEVSLSEFKIEGQLTAPAGNVVLNVFNDGAIEHNLAIKGTDILSKNLLSRGLDIVNVPNLTAGTYELYCTIPGHEGSGMVADLVITEPGTAAPAAAAGSEELTPAQMDQAMIDSMLAFPAATEGKGNQPLDFVVLADGTKQFELTAAVTPWEVSPGQIVEAWTYNGIVPAPEIRLDVGDKVQIIVHNETELATDVHWHGIHTPNDQDGVSPYTQDPIASGETFTYEFVAEDPGIGMYHAHMHSQISVLNGMFGAFIIGENPLPYGQTVSGVTIPEAPRDRHGDADGAQRRRRDRLVAERQELPGDRTTRARRGLLGRRPLLQRGPDGAPDAPAPVPHADLRQGRHPARSALLGRHDQRGSGRAVLDPVPGDRSGHLGVALPHPHPRGA